MSDKKRGGYEKASTCCKTCQGDARCVGIRQRWIDSLLGPFVVKRHYYHCRVCRHGFFPRDSQLRLDKRTLSPAAREVVSIAGVQNSFGQSSEITLKKLCGLKVSESTVERVTEDAGERLKELLEAGETFGEKESWQWQCDARGKTCAYVSLDATGVRQQGLKGARADGRMAQVGMIYNTKSAHDDRTLDPHSVRYLSGFYTLSALGTQLRRQAAQVGWDEAEQQIALSDGGSGLENFLRVHFPLAEHILDFWHASEYLVELGQALFADNETLRTKRVSAWCHQLKHQGGLHVLTLLQEMETPVFFVSAASRARRLFALLSKSSPQDGLPEVFEERLANRQRSGGKCLQDGGGRKAKTGRHALGQNRLRCYLPPPRPIPQPARPMGGILEKPTQLTTYFYDAHTLWREFSFSYRLSCLITITFPSRIDYSKGQVATRVSKNVRYAPLHARYVTMFSVHPKGIARRFVHRDAIGDFLTQLSLLGCR